MDIEETQIEPEDKSKPVITRRAFLALFAVTAGTAVVVSRFGPGGYNPNKWTANKLKAALPSNFKRFILTNNAYPTANSTVTTFAYGIQFPNKHCLVLWTDASALQEYDSLEHVQSAAKNKGTHVVWMY